MMQIVGQYFDAFAGEDCVIVGKGPTDFDYENLQALAGPVIFINDAIQFEDWALGGRCFWFAHDANQSVWMKKPGPAAAVLPIQNARDSHGRPMITIGQVLKENGVDWDKPDPPETCSLNRDLIGYVWDLDFWLTHGVDGLTILPRNGLRAIQNLFLNSGTIHSAIHFAWLCGCKRIVFVGCDGVVDAGYDERIDLRGNTEPGRSYGKIRRVQDEMIRLLDLDAVYIGTPKK